MILFGIRRSQVFERILKYIANAFLEVLQPCASRSLCYCLKRCIGDVFWHIGIFWIVKNVLSQPKDPIILLMFYSPEWRMRKQKRRGSIKINCSRNGFLPLEFQSLICAFFGWLCLGSAVPMLLRVFCRYNLKAYLEVLQPSVSLCRRGDLTFCNKGLKSLTTKGTNCFKKLN